jgi:hypothetical protein
MNVGFLIKTTGAVPSNMPKRVYNNEILKPAWDWLGRHFHQRYLPLRFTVAGGNRLRYTPRSGQRTGKRGTYMDWKRRKLGHVDPLVKGGESRGLAKIRDVRATSKGVRIVNHARKLNFRNPKSRIDMAEEVRSISWQEGRELTRKLDEVIGHRLKRFRKVTSKKV